MGLFGRRRGEDALGDEQRVAVLARQAFADRGVETTLTATEDALDSRLVGMDGTRFLLHNLILAARRERPAKWQQLADEHVDRMLSDLDAVPLTDLDEEQLRAGVRSRLVADVEDEMTRMLGYARPFLPGVVEILCVDRPSTVATITDAQVPDLAVPLDELFAVGRLNTAQEPIDELSELAEGVLALEGASLFVASHVTTIERVIETTIGAAPYGLLFAIPHRSLMLAVVPHDSGAIKSISTLLALLPGFADRRFDAPGGVISTDVFYWSPDGFERVGGIEPDGTVALHAAGRFGEMLDELPGPD